MTILLTINNILKSLNGHVRLAVVVFAASVTSTASAFTKAKGQQPQKRDAIKA